MFENEDNKTPATCSFCGKTEDQVKSMISGPGVYICNECVELAQSIIDTETKAEANLCQAADSRAASFGNGQ